MVPAQPFILYIMLVTQHWFMARESWLCSDWCLRARFHYFYFIVIWVIVYLLTGVDSCIPHLDKCSFFYCLHYFQFHFYIAAQILFYFNINFQCNPYQPRQSKATEDYSLLFHSLWLVLFSLKWKPADWSY